MKINRLCVASDRFFPDFLGHWNIKRLRCRMFNVVFPLRKVSSTVLEASLNKCENYCSAEEVIFVMTFVSEIYDNYYVATNTVQQTLRFDGALQC